MAQLLETPLLNLINYPSLIATNAARLRLAAGPDKDMLEFGLRRAQVRYGLSRPSPSKGRWHRVTLYRLVAAVFNPAGFRATINLIFVFDACYGIVGVAPDFSEVIIIT